MLLTGADVGFGQSIEQPRELPAEFRAHRIYVHPVTTSGDTLHLYTDTGGGRLALITPPTVERLGLSPDTLRRRNRELPFVEFPEFRQDASIPPAPDGRMYVYPMGSGAKMTRMRDGLLGNGWFGGRVWTFDYGEEELRLHPNSAEIESSSDHVVALDFRTDSTGRRTNNHPGIEATVAGETYSFLFDTGATSVLTEEGRNELGGPVRRASSFVTTSLLEQWMEAHPDWRVVEGASRFSDALRMIRVPELRIAGHTVGPVWFEERPDRNFHERMSALVGRHVEGALGGSLFRYFEITVDYPRGWAQFEKLD